MESTQNSQKQTCLCGGGVCVCGLCVRDNKGVMGGCLLAQVKCPKAL